MQNTIEIVLRAFREAADKVHEDTRLMRENEDQIKVHERQLSDAKRLVEYHEKNHADSLGSLKETIASLKELGMTEAEVDKITGYNHTTETQGLW